MGPGSPPVSLPELHLSKPGVQLPATRVDNAEIIRRVRARFKGTDDRVRQRSRRRSSTSSACARRRSATSSRTSARASSPTTRWRRPRSCLEVNDVSLDEVDLVICGQHRAPVLRAGDRDGGRRQARPQADARLRRDRRLRGPPGGDPDGGRLSGACTRRLPDRAGLHLRAVGPVPELRHPDRPRPADEDGGPDHRQRGRLRAAAPEAVSRRRHPPARRSTRSPRPTTGSFVRCRSAARWSRRRSS